MTASKDDDFIDNPGLESDSDFSEFDTVDQRSIGGGDAWKSNPMMKIGLVVGAFAAIIGSIILFGGSEDKTPPSLVSGSSATDLKAIPGQEEVSPAMRDAYEEVNAQNTEEAIRTDGSVIPMPIDPPQNRVELEPQQAATEDPLNTWRRMQEERLRTQQAQAPAANPQQAAVDTARDQAVSNLAQAMSNQMSQILSTRQIANLRQMVVTDPKAVEAERQQQAAAIAAANQQTVAPDNVKILIPAGTIEYAQLLIEANSDVQGPVVALIVTGPYAGSRVLGAFERQTDYLVISFDVIVKDGISIPIEAVALDPDTTLPGMASYVDRRYFQRIILPAAAKFVEGMGSAIADTGGSSTSVSVNDTTVVEDEGNEPDTEEEFFKGVEEAAREVGDLLDEEADEVQTLVVVKAGTPMGILFTLPVTDQDVELGRQGKTKQDLEEEQNSTILPTLQTLPSAVPASAGTQQLIQTISGDQPR